MTDIDPEELPKRFLGALSARRAGDIDRAAELLRGIIRTEPRLAEPRLELANILLATDQPAEAEEQAREAVGLLESSGQWNQDLPPEVMLSLALSTLGEALRRVADSDEVVFGEPERWEALMNESRTALDRAQQLDPDNEHAAEWSWQLQLPGLTPSAELSAEEPPAEE